MPNKEGVARNVPAQSNRDLSGFDSRRDDGVCDRSSAQNERPSRKRGKLEIVLQTEQGITA